MLPVFFLLQRFDEWPQIFGAVGREVVQRGGHACVAEDLLHDSQVVGFVVGPRGERAAQIVDVQVAADSQPVFELPEPTSGDIAGDRAAVESFDERGLGCAGVRGFREMLQYPAGDGHGSGASAFLNEGDGSLVGVQILLGQRAGFGVAKPAIDGQQQDHAQFRLGVGEQGFDFPGSGDAGAGSGERELGELLGQRGERGANLLEEFEHYLECLAALVGGGSFEAGPPAGAQRVGNYGGEFRDGEAAAAFAQLKRR